MAKITTIIFDWAGVFCSAGEPFSHPRLRKETGLTVAEIGEKTKSTQRSYYLGKIKTNEFWGKIIDFFKLKNLTREELSQAYLSSYRIYPEMLELVKNLKNNYKTAILSNLTEEMTEHIIKTHDIKKYFTFTFFSNQIGLMKPDKKAYEFALGQIKSAPGETVFIDDSAANVAAAKNLGMNTILFASPAQCKKKLAELGIKL